MSEMCCGDKCKNCEHCQNYPCETCECCQPQRAGEDTLEAEPHGADPSWRSTAERRKQFGQADLPHPVDAADELLAAGEFDTTRFLEQALSKTGHVWPAGCTARSLFDDLVGRGSPQRRQEMKQHFAVIALPGRTLRLQLQPGDIVIRRADGDFAHAAMIAHPVLYREQDAAAHGLVLEGPWPGFYAHMLEPGMFPRQGRARFARRVASPDGQVLPDTLVVRPRTPGEAIEGDEADEGLLDILTGKENPFDILTGKQNPPYGSGGGGTPYPPNISPYRQRPAPRAYQPDPNMRWLQAALNRAINAGLAVDGIDGPLTRAAIRRFQAARGLAVDGIAGPQTRAALAAVYPPPGVYGGYTPPSSYTPLPYTPPGGYQPPPPPYTPPGGYQPPPPPPPYTPPGGDYPPPPPPPPGYKPPGGDYPPPPPPPPPYTPPAYSPSEAVPPGATCRTLDTFAYDSAALTAAHRATIEELAQRMLQRNVTSADIIGHASPEGPAAYNLALGQRRADSVARALREALDRRRASAGARIRFSVTSQGEANAVSTEASRNRRVEVCYVEGAPPIVPPQTQTRIRYSIDTPEGRAMLRKYEQAVRLMMAEPAGSPRSWLFQWYTHAVRDDRGKTAEINRIYGSTPSANRSLANAMWNTCQAHHPGNNELFFLPWHRMYVDFFERICRRMLNDEAFTLPYWNYSRAGAASLPAAFRSRSSPLFRADRNPGVNNGTPIDQGAPDGFLSPANALALRNYGPQGVAQGFNDFLDGDLHGNVHVAVGNTRGMGAVPWAANDPIFWLHHCNIDRLWASWNRAGRRNPTDATWLGQTFTFADENGQRIDAVVRDFNTTTARGYTYDQFEQIGAQPVSEAIMANEADSGQDRRSRTVASSTGTAARPSGGIALGATPLTVRLAPTTEDAPAFSDQIEALGDEQRLYLRINNYKAEAQPGVLYHVYLDLPSGPGDQHREGHYVGTMNFFDAVPHSGHEPTTMSGKSKSFDVTAVVRRLRAEGRAGTAPSVTIVPAGRPASQARPVIGDISLVGQ